MGGFNPVSYMNRDCVPEHPEGSFCKKRAARVDKIQRRTAPVSRLPAGAPGYL